MAAKSDQGEPGGAETVVRAGALTALLREVARVPEAAQGVGWDDALRPGAVFDRFELVREIGRGGFGLVWEAVDREVGRRVAFKAVRAGSALSIREERLLREGEAAARLAHPNLVSLHDVGRTELGPYLVLELLEGETLEARLARGPLPVAEALRVATEVARGLAHAHLQGVVHRDLKPGNVFLCAEGRVKVLDFGLAHAFGQRRADGGTPAYMAPEQWERAPEDERTDVFALGVLLHEMLTGRLPFPDGGRWAQGPGAAPRLVVEGAPELGPLVAAMLEKSPVRRLRDGAEALRTLEEVAARLARAGPAAELRARPASLLEELRRRRVFRALLTYAAFAFAGLYLVEPVTRALGLAEGAARLAVALLATGFPVTAGIAWAYDLTTPGFHRTEGYPSGPGGRGIGRARLFAVLGALSLVAALPLAAFYLWRGELRRPAATATGTASSPAADRSVAVPPFEDAGPEGDEEALPEGLARRLARREWREALADAGREAALRPGDPAAQRTHAWVLASVGRRSEAVAAARRATDLEPAAARNWRVLGLALRGAGDLEGSRRAYLRSLEIAPGHEPALRALAVLSVLEGRPVEALDAVRSLPADGLGRLAVVALAEHQRGDDAGSRRALAELEARGGLLRAFRIAEVHAWRGEVEEALAWLERADEQQDMGLAEVKHSPLLRGLRGDPRFQAFLRTLNLPAD